LSGWLRHCSEDDIVKIGLTEKSGFGFDEEVWRRSWEVVGVSEFIWKENIWKRFEIEITNY
jgi:hypothetical protein